MGESRSRPSLEDFGRRARRGLRRALLPIHYFVLSKWCGLNGMANGLPIPPRELTFLVSGGYNIEQCLRNGILSSETIRRNLSKNGAVLEDFRDILDFGCGPGRILRNWRGLRGRVYGTDCNREVITWCKKNLPFACFDVNEVVPPTSWVDSSFDFIYAFSVFTHLAEGLQRAWTAELCRILRVGGYLMLTTHGQAYLHRLSPDEQARFRGGCLIVHAEGVAGSNAYAIYHPASWVRQNLTEGFRLVDYVAEGASGTGQQDIFLLQKN